MPWTKAVYGSRCFLVADYSPDLAGNLRPAKPSLCSAAHEGASGLCEINIHSYRARKCGPGFDLAIFVCKIHDLTFTIYPPGWSPYSRRRLVGEGSTLEAVDDLAAGRAWPEQSNSESPTERTQRRWTLAWSILIGIDPSTCDDAHLKAGICLGIPTIFLLKSTNKIRAGPTMKGRAQCILSMLSSYKPSEHSLIKRGFQIGYWGKCINAPGLSAKTHDH